MSQVAFTCLLNLYLCNTKEAGVLNIKAGLSVCMCHISIQLWSCHHSCIEILFLYISCVFCGDDWISGVENKCEQKMCLTSAVCFLTMMLTFFPAIRNRSNFISGVYQFNIANCFDHMFLGPKKKPGAKHFAAICWLSCKPELKTLISVLGLNEV